jgi:hypothetical protein
MWKAIYEVWENVLALLEIGTTHEQEIGSIRESLREIERRQRATTVRLLRLEARVRSLERRLPD